MPQMNKGGKFIFGKSLIRTDGTLRIPPQAMEEYQSNFFLPKRRVHYSM